MIESIIEMITALASNSSPLSFTTDIIRTRSANCYGWLQRTEATPLYKILEGGRYQASFNANVTSATAGTVALGLYQDGVLLPGTTVIAEITTPGDYYNVSFNRIIEVCCRDKTTLTVASVPNVVTGAIPPGTPVETEIPVFQNANFTLLKKS